MGEPVGDGLLSCSVAAPDTVPLRHRQSRGSPGVEWTVFIAMRGLCATGP